MRNDNFIKKKKKKKRKEKLLLEIDKKGNKIALILEYIIAI
jgi:hypothetical protein